MLNINRFFEDDTFRTFVDRHTLVVKTPKNLGEYSKQVQYYFLLLHLLISSRIVLPIKESYNLSSYNDSITIELLKSMPYLQDTKVHKITYDTLYNDIRLRPIIDEVGEIIYRKEIMNTETSFFIYEELLDVIECDNLINVANFYTGINNKFKYIEDLYLEFRSRYNLTNHNCILNTSNSYLTIADKLTITNYLTESDDNTSIVDNKLRVFNPNMAKLLRTKTIPLSDAFILSDVNVKQLEKNLKTLSRKKYDILSIGLGGSMSNFFYWCDEFRKYFRLDSLFNKIIVCEPDELDFSNLPRIPLDYMSNIVINNIDIYHTNVNCRSHIPKNVAGYHTPIIKNKSIMLLNHRELYNEIKIYPVPFGIRNDYEEKDGDYYYSRDLISYTEKKIDFVIGTPNLETRAGLYNLDVNFICPSHQNNTLSIDINPKVDGSDFLVENYGSIDLSLFFINMIKMTEKIIEVLVQKDFISRCYFEQDLTLDMLKERASKLKQGYIIQ